MAESSPSGQRTLWKKENCDENGRKFFQWAENTVEKGEIAHNEQFLLLPQCFQKTCTADT